MSQRQHAEGRASALPFETSIDLPEADRSPVVERLNRSLADTTDLQTQLKYAHWNVKGPAFQQLHRLFDEIAELLAEHADQIAERATALGGRALGTVRMSASATRIPEMPIDVATDMEFVAVLVDHLAVHAANLRDDVDAATAYDDQDTADMFTELSREVDKRLWFLEAHIQDRDVARGERADRRGGERSEGRRSRLPSHQREESEATGGQRDRGERRGRRPPY